MVFLARALGVFGTLFLSIALTSFVHAQSMPDIEQSIVITVDPLNPAPGAAVRLSAEDSAMDLRSAIIAWEQDGKKISSGAGVTSITVTAPPLGQSIDISVTADENGVSAQAHAVLRPTDITILYESDSYIPPFFAGRALPSAGTSVRLVALPRFVRSDGTLIPSDQITFNWKRNGYALSDVSGVGKSFIVVPAPVFSSADIISVDAHVADGSYTGSASITVPSVSPELLLYTDHPLFGITFYSPLSPQSFIPESVMTFAAIPYYVQAATPSEQALRYAWTINSAPVTADTVKPNEVTLDAGKASGAALIQLSISRADNIFMNLSKTWTVSFSSSLRENSSAGTTGASNPFEKSSQ